MATELVCDRDWEVLQLTLQRFAVLCYERDSAVAGFYETDVANGIQLLQEYSGWRQSWTFIVPGVFGDSGYDGLLLYDQQAGFGAIYDTDGQGNLILASAIQIVRAQESIAETQP